MTESKFSLRLFLFWEMLMFWRNWSWATRVLCVAGLGFVAVVLYPVFFGRGREIGGPIRCSSLLKQVGLGFAQYTQDYDDKLPPIASGGSTYGWVDAIFPYVKSEQIFNCPQQKSGWQSNSKAGRHTSYPLNARLARQSISKITAPTRQILSLDGNDGTDRTDARYSLSQIPTKWRQNAASPLYRHKGTANYLFADGHVESLLPWRITDANGIVF